MRVRRHPAEQDRLDSLHSYGVLDSAAEPSFDALASLAAAMCDTPIGAVSFVDADRQWTKAAHGYGMTQTARELSFCSDAVAMSAPLVVPDATADPRYLSNELVTGPPFIRAYAGVPLVGRDGLPLGALCVIDRRPRAFTDQDLAVLTGLADQVVVLLEQRRRDLVSGVVGGGMLAQAREPGRLRAALDDGELVPHYQPVVDLLTGRLHGLEALIRWEHPQLGVLSPAAFLPAIEACALVVPVGKAVLHQALDQLGRLRSTGAAVPGGVAVNVASGQLARPGLARAVLTALAARGLPGEDLALEITEATALHDVEVARRELQVLAEAGVHVVVDDFGVGWSNLARVLQLPVDALKIDRAIAGAVLRDGRAASMVRSTMRLAADLGLDVVAEGVETQDVRRHLQDAGCRWGQGWLFSPAVPGTALPDLQRDLG